ncbi:MAG: ATP-binding protein, partial [Aquificae bacterium]|nr:ATP-binding protein [Aquificota bacterium]
RWESGTLQPVEHAHLPSLESLVGIEHQKRVLYENTLFFVEGLPANDALLWGAKGTGKSSLVKALLKEFLPKGLRLVQVYRTSLRELSRLFGMLRRRKEKFVLFLDDISFSGREEEFFLLKTLLEGDVEERPPNVIVYATTNRRNVVRQEEEGEKFPEDSLHESLSLADRFGIKLYFPPMDLETYLSCVENYLKGWGLSFSEEVKREALRWASERSGFSGRTALQFARYHYSKTRLGNRT